MALFRDRDFEVLNELRAFHDQGGEWARPLDCGGHDGSDHSYRLNKAVEACLVEVRQRSAHYSRGSKEYRLTDQGRKAVDCWRARQSTPTKDTPQ